MIAYGFEQLRIHEFFAHLLLCRFSFADLASATSLRRGRAMRPISVRLMAALVVTGGSAQAARDPAPVQGASAAASVATQTNLDGTEWHVVEVNGTAVPNGVKATLRLRGSHASGRTGCNAYGASYETAADGSAKFGQAVSTNMACLTPAVQCNWNTACWMRFETPCASSGTATASPCSTRPASRWRSCNGRRLGGVAVSSTRTPSRRRNNCRRQACPGWR